MTRIRLRRALVRLSASLIVGTLVVLLATIADRSADRGRDLEAARAVIAGLHRDLDAVRTELEDAKHRQEDQARLLEALAAEVRRLGGNPDVFVTQAPRPAPSSTTVVVPSSPTAAAPPTTTTTSSTTTTTTCRASTALTGCALP